MRNSESKTPAPNAVFLTEPPSVMSGEVPKGKPTKKKNEWVRAIRGKRTQEKFAEKLGVLRSTVAKWESGVDAPSHENTLKLQRLMEQEGQTPVLPSVASRMEDDMEQELLRLFRGLSTLERAKLLVDLSERGVRRSQDPAAPSSKA